MSGGRMPETRSVKLAIVNCAKCGTSLGAQPAADVKPILCIHCYEKAVNDALMAALQSPAREAGR